MADEQKPERPPAIGTYDANPTLRELNRRAEESASGGENPPAPSEAEEDSGGSEE